MTINTVRWLVGIMIITSFASSSITLFSIAGFNVSLFDIALLAVVFFHLLKKASNKNRKVLISKQLLYGIFFTLLTIINCVDLLQWVKGIVNTLRILLCIVILVENTRSKADSEFYTKSFMYGVFLVIIVSIYESLTGVHLFSNYAGAYASDEWMYKELLKAPTAFLFNPNNVACVVVLGIPWARFLLPEKYKTNILIQLLYYALSLYVIFMTGSRGGIAAGVVLTGISIFVEGKNNHKLFWYSAIVIAAVIFILFKYSDFISRQLLYASFTTSGKFSFFISADSSRINSIKRALNIFISTFGIGCGPWCYEIYHDVTFGRPDSVHFFIVELLTCYGLIVFVLFISFYMRLVKRMRVLVKIDNEARKYFWVLIVWLIVSIIPPTIFTLYIFWIALGICIGHIKIYQLHTPAYYKE